MRVLVLTDEYEPNVIGGLGIVATRLAREVSDWNLDVTVISGTPLETAHEEWDEVRVFRFPCRLSKYHSGRAYRPEPIARHLTESGLPRPDVIHVHSVPMAVLAERLKRKYRSPLVYTCHSLVCEEAPSPHRARLAAEQRRLIARADRVVVPSSWQLADLRRHYPAWAGKAMVIPNGVDRSIPWGYGADTDRLLYVGRVVQHKGIEQLLAAIPLLRRHRDGVTLTIVGSGPAAYVLRLRQMVKRLGVERHVLWAGSRDHWLIQEAYPRFGAVVVPSRRESFGLVALEALAAGVPLVSTRSGGLAEFISPAVASVIRAPTAEAVATAVLSVWRNPRLAQARVARGRAIAAHYSWDSIAARYRRLFVSLSGRSGGSVKR